MKILIWSPFINKVGTTTNVINSILALKKFSKKEKYSIDLVDVFGEWSEYEFRGIDINKIKLLNNRFILKRKKNGFLRSRFYTILIFLSSIVPFLKLLKKNDYNFIIAHLITSVPILLFLFIKTNTKLILSIAGHPKINFMRKFIWKISSKKLFKIICPSNELKNILINLNIFTEDKITVIQDPHLSIKKIKELKIEKINDPFFDGSKVLISVGRLTKQKNYTFLLLNFKKLLTKYRDIKLLIIGSGEEKKILQNLITKLKIEDKVKLLGYEKNIYRYLKNSNFYISTSIWEGSSLAMIDAAYMGLPLLCSNCPAGRKEFIEKDKRGFLFNEGDSKNFLYKFDKMYKSNFNDNKTRLINAKKEVRNFTLFRYYLCMAKILNN